MTTHESSPPKKKRRTAGGGGKAAVPDDSTAPPAFLAYRLALDSGHATRERLIKASRDTTAEAKKVIFALHRAPPLPAMDDGTQRVCGLQSTWGERDGD